MSIQAIGMPVCRNDTESAMSPPDVQTVQPHHSRATSHYLQMLRHRRLLGIEAWMKKLHTSVVGSGITVSDLATYPRIVIVNIRDQNTLDCGSAI
jgi:hypothetical protein